MTTADTVKAKLLNLLTKANNVTGGNDADLTTATDALISGVSQSKIYLAMLNGDDLPEAGGTLNIPEGIRRIAPSFYNNLTSIQNLTVVLPSSVKRIGSRGFENIANYAAGAGTQFVFNETLENIDSYAFSGARFCKFVGIPASVKTIGERAFAGAQVYGGAYTEDLNFPEIEALEKDAFSGFVFGGANVYIGKNISSIGNLALAFASSSTFTITIERAEDAIGGAPWGAANATIVWTGDT